MNGVLFNFDPHTKALEMINNGSITPAKINQRVGIGYLKGDMHRGIDYDCREGMAIFQRHLWNSLKPRDPTAARPEIADLIVNGVPIAEVHLIGADAGPQLMQTEATGSVVMGYAGVPPAIYAIDKGAPIKILMPINDQGSGLVSAINSPATDWNSS